MKLPKLKKILKRSTAILFLCALELGCASVEIKDQVWYANLEDEGAIEFHTLKPDTRELTKEEWKQISFGTICATTDTFAENKKIILKLCTDNPRCAFEVQQALENFFINIEQVQQEVQSRTLP